MFRSISMTAIALAVAVPALAQTTMSGTTDPNQVIGQEVQARNGEQIGTVRDVLMGSNNQITGIIVDTDQGMSPQGDVAFDWSDVTTHPTDRRLVVDASPEMLEGVPSGYSTGASGTGAMGTSGQAVPDVSESQPSVIGGEDIEGQGIAPMGAGGTDGGETRDSGPAGQGDSSSQ